MPFTKFVRTRVQADEPVIAISDNRFQYSSVFSKLSELEKYPYVEYFVEEDNRKIAFKFHKEPITRDCYIVNKSSNYRSAALEVMNRYPWVDKVAQAQNSDDRKFVALKLQGMWVIQLSPSFEISVDRSNSPKGLPEQSGIYQYVNDKGDIVYIGKGNIKQRHMDRQRKDWIYSKVEYSIVDGDEAQYEWESYWLEKYKEKNDGYLPYYNKVSGHKSKT